MQLVLTERRKSPRMPVRFSDCCFYTASVFNGVVVCMFGGYGTPKPAMHIQLCDDFKPIEVAA